MSSPVTVEDRNGLRLITLARPEKANALSAEMSDGVHAAIEGAEAAGARAIALKGDGRHFCAGFDFGDFEALTDGDLALRFLHVEEMLQAMFHAPMPTLALVHGRAVGAGADLAAAAMKVVAAPGARLAMPGPRFGVVLGTRRLAYRVGNVRARQIQIENRPVEAAEGLAIGLIDEIVEMERWDETIAAFATAYTVLDRETAAELADVTRPDARDADLAALARSVAKPGIKARIKAFRAGG